MKRSYRIFFISSFIISLFIIFYHFDYFWEKLITKNINHYNYKINKRLIANKVLAYWDFNDPRIDNKVSLSPAINYGAILTEGLHGRGRSFNESDENHIKTLINWRELGKNYTLSILLKINQKKSQAILFSSVNRLQSGIILKDGIMTFHVPNPHKEQKISYQFNKYNQFVHLIAICNYDQKKAFFYENSKLMGVIDIDDIYYINRHISFGKYKDHHIYYPFSGMIDEAVIFKKALSDKEVKKHNLLKNAVPKELAASLSLKYNFFITTKDIANRIIKYLDFFNPFIHQSYISKENSLQIDLLLSKSDIKYLNKYHNKCIQTGFDLNHRRKPRKAHMLYNGKLLPIKIQLYAPNALYWGKKRPAFIITLTTNEALQNMQQFICVPPEINGFILPLLEGMWTKKLGISDKNHGLIQISFNEVFKGYYYFEEHIATGYRSFINSQSSILSSMPIEKTNLLKDFDLLENKHLRNFINDRASTLNSHQIQRAIKKEKKELLEISTKISELPNQQIIDNAAQFIINNNFILKDNPSLSYIISDLTLPWINLPKLKIEWISSHPKYVTKKGIITRPLNNKEIEFQIKAIYTSQQLHQEETYHGVLIADSDYYKSLPPVINIISPEPIINSYRTPCSIEVITNGNPKKTEHKLGLIKFRGNSALAYPKKCYSIRLPESPNIMNFSQSKIVYLMANFIDRTFMRNKLSYELFKSFAEDNEICIAPKVEYVEVTVNGEYKGFYELVEKVDKHMLKFDSYSKSDAAHNVIYKAVGGKANFKTFYKSNYFQKEPSLEEKEYFQPLKSFIEFIGNSSPQEFRKKIKSNTWINLGNLMNFHILINLTNNRDGFKHNLFIVKNKDTSLPYILIPWDYDEAYERVEGKLENYLFHRLRIHYKRYSPQLKARWIKLRAGQLSEESLLNRIDILKNKLGERIYWEFKRWPKEDRPTHIGQVKALEKWIINRLEILDKYFLNL